jgi:hypothetical protein
MIVCKRRGQATFRSLAHSSQRIRHSFLVWAAQQDPGPGPRYLAARAMEQVGPIAARGAYSRPLAISFLAKSAISGQGELAGQCCRQRTSPGSV